MRPPECCCRRNRAAIDGDRLRRRRAAAAAEAEIVLQSADRIRKTRACLAAQLTDALLQVAGALRDAEHGARAEARDVADQVRADAGRLKPTFDRINIAQPGIQLAAKIENPALWLGSTRRRRAPPRCRRPRRNRRPPREGRATGARGEREDGIFDGVQDVVEVATAARAIPGAAIADSTTSAAYSDLGSTEPLTRPTIAPPARRCIVSPIIRRALRVDYWRLVYLHRASVKRGHDVMKNVMAGLAARVLGAP